MSKESYLSPPPLVEVYEIGGGTDIILRKNVEESSMPGMEGQEDTTCYTCDQEQCRYPGKITVEEIQGNFEYWWSTAEGKTEIEAIDNAAAADGKLTALERIEAVEASSSSNTEQLLQTQEAICELYEMLGGMI